MIESMHMPKEVMEAQLLDIDIDENSDDSRIVVVEAANEFLR